MVQNRKNHGKKSYLIIHCPKSEGVSVVSEVSEVSAASSVEQANKTAVQRTSE